ncbi:hypothetical protein [Bartonella elizabethae]|uniref:hypothetical protein n=1 Tax=Bartonella elizabethae TaxID=807 RepID=UPI00047A94CF|nr:hypothetical protein [Bartonella elizabethae]
MQPREKDQTTRQSFKQHPQAAASSLVTHTPCPTAPRQGLHFPHKQTNSCVAVLEGLSKSQAHWQAKKFRNDEPTKTRKKPTKQIGKRHSATDFATRLNDENRKIESQNV